MKSNFFLFFESLYQFTKRFHHQLILYAQNQIFEIDFFSFFRFIIQSFSDEQKSIFMINEIKKNKFETINFSQNQRQINNSDKSNSEQSDFKMNEIILASNFIANQRQKLMNIITTVIKMSQRFQNSFNFSSSLDFDFDLFQNQNSN